jgi:hypothetical protein
VESFDLRLSNEYILVRVRIHLLHNTQKYAGSKDNSLNLHATETEICCRKGSTLQCRLKQRYP